MLKRASAAYQETHPSYKGVSVCVEWHSLSAFKAWMQQQDWEGKQLDKDILVPGNKLYSPETCAFVTLETNSFVTDRAACRGAYMIGVDKPSHRYQATIRANGKKLFLGLFDTELEAHTAWRLKKIELANELADRQTDPRVATALRLRYLPTP
jgi:hypothetical protein